MSGNPAAVLGALATTPESRERGISRSVLVSRLLMGFIIALVAFYFAFAIRQLWVNWQTATWGDWTGLLPLFIAPLQLTTTLLRVFGRTSDAAQNKRLRQRVRALRDAFFAGDERIAPIAKAQPEPRADTLMPNAPQQIGPLRPLRATQLTTGDILATVGVVLGFCAGITAAALIPLALTESGTANPIPLWPGLLAGGLALVLFTPSLARLIYTVRSGRPQYLEADEFGLRWAKSTRRLGQGPISWVEARAFLTVAYGSNKLSTRYAYILATNQQVIAWIATENRYAPDREPSLLLQQVIVARTKLPLRDFTSAFKEAITSQIKSSEVAIEHAYDSPIHQVLATNGLHVLSEKRSLKRVLITALLLVLVFALVFVAQWPLQRYQTSYLAGLPARIHAEQPLYQDALTAPDGDWNIEEPTAKDPSSFRYLDQSYQITGIPGNFYWSWTQGTYSNVAVEVTVRQTINPQTNLSSDGDGVGLILRTNADTSNFIVFNVSPLAQDWSLEHYQASSSNPDENWDYLADGISNAIHSGLDATNTLLVIIRGDTYLLYANGQYLGSSGEISGYSSRNLPESGHMGVYLNDGAAIGAYTNFAVYPVQPPSSFWFV